LERQVGLSGAPKAQRTSEEVQHLQLVIHALKGELNLAANNSFEDTPVELKIETSRDKPTYLSVESSHTSSTKALSIAHALSSRAIEISEATQQVRTDEILNKLRTRVAESQGLLAKAQEALATHINHAPATEISDLREQAARLRTKLQTKPTSYAPDSPALKKLYIDLAAARGLYSDIHPKVRLIRTRITRAQLQVHSDSSNDASQAASKQRLQNLNDTIAAHQKFDADGRRLDQDIAMSAVANAKARDALAAAQQGAEASRIRLKVVQDAALTGRDQNSIRAALLGALLLVSLVIAVGSAALRIRLDRNLRHPRDLHNALGLTPFATLPDLGPSLG
jgi:hypothetical protein